MLILSRKAGEQILIADEIVVIVRRINGDRVSIGIQAPRSIEILRGELHAATPPEPNATPSSV